MNQKNWLGSRETYLFQTQVRILKFNQKPISSFTSALIFSFLPESTLFQRDKEAGLEIAVEWEDWLDKKKSEF